MASNPTNITGTEQGRARFAYECAYQNLSLKTFNFKGKEINTSELIIKAFDKKFEKGKDSQIYKDFMDSPIESHRKYASEKNGMKKKIAVFYEKYGGDFKSYVKKTPMLIKMNGLGATFAFIKSKSKNNNAYTLIYEQTAEWLKNDDKKLIDLSGKKDLVGEIVRLDSFQYRALTIEVLAFFNWLRRFAEGLIEGDDE